MPGPDDLKGLDPDELRQFKADLEKSVQVRIRKITDLGREQKHGERQGDEARLVNWLQKYLGSTQF